jgi:hypothetical protein
LVFNLIIQGNDPHMLHTSIDLLADLIRSVNVLASLASYHELEPSLHHVIRLMLKAAVASTTSTSVISSTSASSIMTASTFAYHQHIIVLIPILRLLHMLMQNAALHRVVTHLMFEENGLPVVLSLTTHVHSGVALLASRMLRVLITGLCPSIGTDSLNSSIMNTSSSNIIGSNGSVPITATSSVAPSATSVQERAMRAWLATEGTINTICSFLTHRNYLAAKMATDNDTVAMTHATVELAPLLKPSSSSITGTTASGTSMISLASPSASMLLMEAPGVVDELSGSTSGTRVTSSVDGITDVDIESGTRNGAARRLVICEMLRLLHVICSGRHDLRRVIASILLMDDIAAIVAAEMRTQQGRIVFGIVNLLMVTINDYRHMIRLLHLLCGHYRFYRMSYLQFDHISRH